MLTVPRIYSLRELKSNKTVVPEIKTYFIEAEYVASDNIYLIILFDSNTGLLKTSCEQCQASHALYVKTSIDYLVEFSFDV